MQVNKATRRKQLQAAASAIPVPQTAEDAAIMRARAQVTRALARRAEREFPNAPEATQCCADQAAIAERRAAKRLKLPKPPVIATGREMLPQGQAAEERPGWVHTLQSAPDQIAAEASLGRVELAAAAGVLTEALDAAESMGARNSIEIMLAHQMAALHKHGMDFLAQAGGLSQKASIAIDPARHQQLTIEAARLTNAATRCFTVYQEAMAQAQRAREGSRQTIIVQHVYATGGGQAIVNAGRMTGLGRRKVANGHANGHGVNARGACQ